MHRNQGVGGDRHRWIRGTDFRRGGLFWLWSR